MTLGKLIDLLQYKNENSPNQRWENPSKWLRDWTSKMKIVAADCQDILTQIKLIDHENEVVSLYDNWGNPSNYLTDKIKEMRDCSRQCLSGFIFVK